MAAPASLPGGTTNRGRWGQTDLARRPGFGPGGELRQGGRVLDAGRRRPDHGATPPPLPDRDRPGPFRDGPGPCQRGVQNTGRRRGGHRPAGAEAPEARGAEADEGSRLRRSGDCPAGRLGGKHVRCGSKATPASARIQAAGARTGDRVGRSRHGQGAGGYRLGPASGGEFALPRRSGSPTDQRGRLLPAIGPGVARVERRDHAARHGHGELRGPERVVVRSGRFPRHDSVGARLGNAAFVRRAPGTRAREGRRRPGTRQERRAAAERRARDGDVEGRKPGHRDGRSPAGRLPDCRQVYGGRTSPPRVLWRHGGRPARRDLAGLAGPHATRRPEGGLVASE